MYINIPCPRTGAGCGPPLSLRVETRSWPPPHWCGWGPEAVLMHCVLQWLVVRPGSCPPASCPSAQCLTLCTRGYPSVGGDQGLSSSLSCSMSCNVTCTVSEGGPRVFSCNEFAGGDQVLSFHPVYFSSFCRWHVSSCSVSALTGGYTPTLHL
jgi:hypothetical protein